MPNILPVIPKRFLDFGTLAIGNTQEVVLADRVDLLQWRELTLKVRIHSHTLTSTNTISVNVVPQHWTQEDPSVQFLPFGGPFIFTTIGASTPSPGVLSLTVPTVGAGPGVIPAMARLTALATRAVAGTMQAALTLEFSTKDA